MTLRPMTRARRSRPRRLLAVGAIAALALGALPAVAGAGVPPWPHSTYAAIPGPPAGVVVDTGGNLCVGQYTNVTLTPNTSLRSYPALNNNLIWTVDTNQNVTTFPTFQTFHASVYDMAVGPDGNLYVTDWANDSVDRITQSGVVTIVASGFDGTPVDLAFNPAGDLYVSVISGAGSPIRPSTTTASALRRALTLRSNIPAFYSMIVHVSMNGVIQSIPTLYREGPAFAFDRYGHLVALSNGFGSFDTFTTSGASATLFGTVSTNGSFSSPFSMAIGGSGDFYVGDWTGVVEGFTPNGQLAEYVAPGGLFRPMGLAFDASGTLFVTDGDNWQVDAFTNLETTWGGFLNHSFPCQGPNTQPTAPLNLKVTRHGGSVTGTWTRQPGNWFLCTLLVGTTASSTTARVTEPTCTFRGLNPGGRYGIRVQALNELGASPIAQALAPPPQVIQITCKKGTKVRHIAGYAPICPIGFHRI